MHKLSSVLSIAKPIRQRTATQQWLVQGDKSNIDMVKFDTPFINSRIVSYPRHWKISFAPNPFIIQVQMLEFTLFDVFLNLA